MKNLFAVVAVLLIAQSANAAVNLITNGEFNTDPVIADHDGNWQIYANGDLDGWKNINPGDPGVELWKQAFEGSPQKGTDGQDTGQTMELNANEFFGDVVQSAVSVGAGSYVFSFDSWLRGVAQAQVTVKGFISGNTYVDASISTLNSPSDWTNNLFNFLVGGADDLVITFATTAANLPVSANSVHIDQVYLAAVPEPATIIVWSGLATIGAVVAYRRRAA